MDACSIIGESTDAIVMDDSPTDEREIQEACQRWVFVLVWGFLWFLVCDLIIVERFTVVNVNVSLPSCGQCEYCSVQLWTMGLCTEYYFCCRSVFFITLLELSFHF